MSKHFRAVSGYYPMGGESVRLFPMKNQGSVDNSDRGLVLSEEQAKPAPKLKRELLMSTRQMTKVWGRSR